MRKKPARNAAGREKAIGEYALAARNGFRLMTVWSELMAGLYGMSMTDVIAVSFLTDTGSATAGEIAAATGLTTGAATAAIDRLEKLGLVAREAHPHDRRKVVVRLSQDAIPPSLKKLRDDVMAEFAPIIARYSNDDFRRMTRFANETSVILKEKIDMMRNLNASQKRQYRFPTKK